MEKILIVENERDQVVKVDIVEGPVEEETYEEVMKAMNKMKLGKAAAPLKSKCGFDNGEWKVRCYNKGASSENCGW